MNRGIDYIGVGVGAVIFNSEEKVFLARRGAKAKNERGTWEFPGGAVKFMERVEDALIREMKEEYGMEIKIEKLLDVANHIIPKEKQHWVSPTFICRFVKGKPKILEPEKCDEIGWFSLDNLPSPLSIVTKMNVESLEKLDRL